MTELDKQVELIQGDCMSLMRDIENASVDMILTDIPYNEVNRSSNGIRQLDKGNADVLTFNLDNFLTECLRISKGCIVIFCGKGQISPIYQFFETQKGTVRLLVWQKSNPSPMNGQHVYLSGVETAVWFKKAGYKIFNPHCKNTVFKYPCGKSKLHPTEKNVLLFKELITDCTGEGGVVLDPCMGSGTTGVACIRTNRQFIGMELDEGYFDIAQTRINKEIIAWRSLNLPEDEE